MGRARRNNDKGPCRLHDLDPNPNAILTEYGQKYETVLPIALMCQRIEMVIASSRCLSAWIPL